MTKITVEGPEPARSAATDLIEGVLIKSGARVKCQELDEYDGSAEWNVKDQPMEIELAEPPKPKKSAIPEPMIACISGGWPAGRQAVACLLEDALHKARARVTSRNPMRNVFVARKVVGDAGAAVSVDVIADDSVVDHAVGAAEFRERVCAALGFTDASASDDAVLETARGFRKASSESVGARAFRDAVMEKLGRHSEILVLADVERMRGDEEARKRSAEAANAFQARVAGALRMSASHDQDTLVQAIENAVELRKKISDAFGYEEDGASDADLVEIARHSEVWAARRRGFPLSTLVGTMREQSHDSLGRPVDRTGKDADAETGTADDDLPRGFAKAALRLAECRERLERCKWALLALRDGVNSSTVHCDPVPVSSSWRHVVDLALGAFGSEIAEPKVGVVECSSHDQGGMSAREFDFPAQAVEGFGAQGTRSGRLLQFVEVAGNVFGAMLLESGKVELVSVRSMRAKGARP